MDRFTVEGVKTQVGTPAMNTAKKRGDGNPVSAFIDTLNRSADGSKTGLKGTLKVLVGKGPDRTQSMILDLNHFSEMSPPNFKEAFFGAERGGNLPDAMKAFAHMFEGGDGSRAAENNEILLY